MLGLIPLAQATPLDKLFEVSSANFCAQTLTTPINMAKFFNMQPQSNFTLNGVQVDAVVVDKPTMSINTTGEQLKAQLGKSSPKKYPENELAQVNLKNVYTNN